MRDAIGPWPALTRDVCVRALKARDARFDGVFYVGITSTGIYCRPICPARVSRPDNRRFFGSAAAAEGAGFRPCRRCRPELAPGRALVDAVSSLANAAARRIAAGALNGRPVRALAAELCVSERHLRRALEREIGVSPVELAQTHRLLLAKRLLSDTSLPISRVAFASGFQSLRRFNVVFRERYGMSPSTLRREPRSTGARRRGARRADPDGAGASTPTPDHCPGDFVRLNLAYREPCALDGLLSVFARETVPGVEIVQRSRFCRTVRIGEHSGVVIVDVQPVRSRDRSPSIAYLPVHVSPSLLPVLMPLLARLRQLFDLDAEPAVVDACLGRAGLGSLVRRRPGVRIPGALDGFEVGLRILLRGRTRPGSAPSTLTGHVIRTLGDPVGTGIPGLSHLPPSAARVADAGASRIARLGVPPRRAGSIAAFASAVTDGTLCLEPGNDLDGARSALMEIPGIGDRLATTIAMRALGWPDTFPATDPALRRAAGVTSPRTLRERAEKWRPWRAYAALHLWLHDERHGKGPRRSGTAGRR